MKPQLTEKLNLPFLLMSKIVLRKNFICGKISDILCLGFEKIGAIKILK